MCTRSTSLSFFLLSVMSLAQVSAAQCVKADHEQTPLGANIFELEQTQTVPGIHGKVFFPDGEAAEAVVIEIFRYAGSENYQGIEKALKHKRVKACVTQEDGKFSFSGLKPGKYLLRAGTLYPHGMNEAHIILVVKPGIKKENQPDGLELVLSLGT